MHWVALAAALGFYLYHVPLVAAVVWREDGVGNAAAVFEGRFALRRAREKIGKAKKKKRKFGKLGLKIAKELLAETEWEELTVRLVVGTGDASQTALLCGLMRAAGNALRIFARRGRIDVRPDFSGKVWRGEARGVIRIKAGRALTALMRIASAHALAKKGA